MPKNKKLEKQITYKLDKLLELVDNINEIQVIDTDDPDTWDSDSLYNLVENLKEALQLLEDKESQSEKDNFGNPLILETGLLSLVDTYQEEENSEKI